MNATQNHLFSFYRWGAVALSLIATFLIIYSSRIQSVTVDEPNHIYCGTEFLQYGTYTAWPENPPLSRVVVAIGPYLKGYKISDVAPKKTMREYLSESYDLDYFSGGTIQDKLFWARIFVLPMFLISAWVVWAWSNRIGGPAAGFLAIGMYVTLPSIIAHSSLATTDITFMASFVVLLWCFSRWVRTPSVKNGWWFGASLAASLLAKYSVLVFFPIAAAAILIIFLRWRKDSYHGTLREWIYSALKSGFMAMGVCALFIWAFYGFSFGMLAAEPVIAAGINEGKISTRLGNLYLPAPEWFAGLKLLLLHNAKGHRAYLFGHISQYGFRKFYPIALLLKTPISFLLFSITGILGVWLSSERKRNWELIALCLIPSLIVISVMPSSINLGLRHILIVYPLAAIGFGVGTSLFLNRFAASLQQWKRQLLLSAFVLWQLLIAIIACPNFLSYFNTIAGREPGALLAGSDLDWGQGLLELSEFSKEHKVDTLHLAYYGVGKSCWYPLPPVTFISGSSRPHGWIAVSEYFYRGVWLGDVNTTDSCSLFHYRAGTTIKGKINTSYRWLDQYPLVAKAGGSIRIYHVP